jgi:hypothetical protein
MFLCIFPRCGKDKTGCSKILLFLAQCQRLRILVSCDFEYRIYILKRPSQPVTGTCAHKRSHACLNATHPQGLYESTFHSGGGAEEKLPISSNSDNEPICFRIASLGRPPRLTLRVFYADPYRGSVRRFMAQAVSRRGPGSIPSKFM